MPRPRGGDWLEDEIRSLLLQGVDVVVSLLEPEEIAELELENERACCEVSGITFLSFPIPDRKIPSSNQQAKAFIRELTELLAGGKSIVIHCRQGIGRASMIAAAVMGSGGIPVDEAFERIAIARGCPVPDTLEQREWVVGLFRS